MKLIIKEGLHARNAETTNVLRLFKDGSAVIENIATSEGWPANLVREWTLGHHYDTKKLRAYLARTWESEWFLRFWSNRYEDEAELIYSFLGNIGHAAGYDYIFSAEDWAEDILEYTDGIIPDDIETFVKEMINDNPNFYFEDSVEQYVAALQERM